MSQKTPGEQFLDEQCERRRARAEQGKGEQTMGKAIVDLVAVHYERLRLAAVQAEAAADMTLSEHRRDGTEYLGAVGGGDAMDAIRDRIFEAATRSAAARWPEVRAEIAELGAPMPDRPPTFGPSGIVRAYLGAQTICCGADDAWDRDAYHTIFCAWGAVRDELRTEAQWARARFARYRLAVSQGVAVAPGTEAGE